MSGFFGNLRQFFHTAPPPIFKIYTASQLKIVCMKARVVLETRMTQLVTMITQDDQKFKYVGQDPNQIYTILLSIGDKVIETESIKILIEMLRKIQINCPRIVLTNGDIFLLQLELAWFQCILWYRLSRQVPYLQDFYVFCLDFFKGVDITMELNVKCEVFQLYPILKFLPKGNIFPLQEVLFYIQPYVSCNIDQPTLDKIMVINKNQIKIQIEQSLPKRPPIYNQPQLPNNQSFPIQQNNIYTPFVPPQQKNSGINVNPYQSNPFNKTNNGTSSNIPFNTNPNNFGNQFVNNFNNSSSNINNFNPQVPNYNPSNNFNQQNNFNPQGNNFNTPNSNFNPQKQNYNSNSQNNFNPLSNNYINPTGPNNFNPNKFNSPNNFNNNSQTFNVQPNSNFNQNNLPPNNNTLFQSGENNFTNSGPQNANSIPNISNFGPDNNTLNILTNPNNTGNTGNIGNISPTIPQVNLLEQTIPKTTPTPKPSLYNSLFRANSNQQQKIVPDPFVFPNIDGRETQQLHNSGQYGGNVTIQRQTHEGFNPCQIQQQIKELEEFQKIQINQNSNIKPVVPQQNNALNIVPNLNIRQDYERDIQNLHFEQQYGSKIPISKQTYEGFKDINYEEQMRLLQEIQRRNKAEIDEQIRKKEAQHKQKEARQENQKIQRQNKRLQDERIRLQMLKLKQVQDQKLLFQENKRKREEEERKRQAQQQQRLQRQEQQHQRQFQARRKERQRQQRQNEVQLNVFADNQRQQIDRGNSGRFSSTMGMKIQFNDEEGEQFTFQTPMEVKSSILRFAKQKQEIVQPHEAEKVKSVPIEQSYQDEKQSLDIIKQHCKQQCESTYKLFYFKKASIGQ